MKHLRTYEGFGDVMDIEEFTTIKNHVEKKYGDKVSVYFKKSNREVNHTYINELFIDVKGSGDIYIRIGGDHAISWGYAISPSFGKESFESWDVDGLIEAVDEVIDSKLNKLGEVSKDIEPSGPDYVADLTSRQRYYHNR